MIRALGVVWVGMWLGFAAIGPAAAQDTERVSLRGSATLAQGLMPVVAESWLRDIGYEDIRTLRRDARLTEIHARRDGQPLIVDIVSSDSTQGYADLVDGRAQIAMMTRRPTVAEREAGWQLGDIGSPEQEFAIALDGVAIVVHRDNAVAQLDVAQLRRLFAGQATDWREVGGKAGAVHIYTDSHAGASRDVMRERVLQHARPSAGRERTGVRALIDAVAADPQAIAFVSLNVVGLNQALPSGVRAVPVSDGVRAIAPTRSNVMSEDYPLSRRLYLYGGQMMGALSRGLALYSVGLNGQRAVARAGRWALTLRPGERAALSDGPEDYRAWVRDSTRLPLSLRFNFSNGDTPMAGSVYDSRTVRDLERIKAFMRLPANRGRALRVFGFADASVGSAAAAMMISNDRADLVAQELMSAGVKVDRARGIGARMPLSGMDGAEGRYRNERVEVWVF